MIVMVSADIVQITFSLATATADPDLEPTTGAVIYLPVTLRSPGTPPKPIVVAPSMPGPTAALTIMKMAVQQTGAMTVDPCRSRNEICGDCPA
jgi:hypothetical protein